MSYITFNMINDFYKSLNGDIKPLNFALKEKTTGFDSIFLSHCHRDKEIVVSFITFLLSKIRCKVYVDWQDTFMPKTANIDTAKRIKDKIGELDYFMVLATENALSSRWVPWEIGIADSTKNNEKILLVPLVDPTITYTGNEYLQLYSQICFGKENILGVYKPNETIGKSLENFFIKDTLWK